MSMSDATRANRSSGTTLTVFCLDDLKRIHFEIE